MKHQTRYARALAGALLFAVSAAVAAAEPTGRELVSRVESLLWGRTLQGEFEMNIQTRSWQRTLQLRVWMDRPNASFIRILAPAREAGIGSLRIGNEMWNYLPSVERVVKIPPSMMMQPWMGSDFTNDDLVKESSIVDDYAQSVAGIVDLDGTSTWRVEAVPKPDAAVVWGKVVYWVRRDNFIPVKQEYYSERGERVRVMTFSDVRHLGGRDIPTRWEMRPVGKPDNVTTIVVRQVRYDEPLDAAIFSQRNLQQR